MAATDRRPIRNAAYRVYFVIRSSTTFGPITGGLTGLDAEVSLDGIAFANCAGTETEIGTTGYGYVDLTAAEMTASKILFRITATNANAIEFFQEICPEPDLDAGVAQAGGNNTITLASTASSTDHYYAGALIEIVTGAGSGQINQIASYTGSTRVARVFRNWTTNPDSTSVYRVIPNTNLLPPHFGTAQAGASTSITLQTNAASTDDYYNRSEIRILSGTGAGQVRTITDYTGSSRVATVDRAWTTTPDSTSVYALAESTNSSGSLDVNVNSIGGNTTAATNAAAFFAGGPILGSVNDGTPAANNFDGDAALTATDDFYNGSVLTFRTGTLAGLSRRITDYTGSTRNFSFATAFPSAPANGDTFHILGRID